MKKFIPILFVLCSSLFAQSIPKASKLMVVNQKNENLSASEANWLPGAVRDRLEVNLQQYTDFLFVDATNISAVKKLQKQSESAGYNESDAIELGKLTVAKFAVFLTLRKSGSGYTVVADVTDLTTGQKLASVMSSAKKTADELFSTTGCAADDITVKLCEKLGITLSNTQKYALTHGDEILSNADQLKMAQEKLKASQEKAKRLEEEAKKVAADKAEDAARSEQQKRRRDQMAKEAAEKVAAVRKATLDNESIFTKINVIESKKKAILDIQKSVDDRIAEIKKDGDDEFAKKKEEIMDAPYRAAEKNADGTPSATAKERREKQVADVRKEIDDRIAKESEEVKKSALVNVNMLYDEIKKDQKNISQTKTVSSLEDDLKVQISTFDGKTNAWNVKYWLYSNGVPVTNGSMSLTYKDLTGKEIDTSRDKTYDEFMDTVDLYNSLFSRGDPVLTFNMDYKTESVDDFTSRYKITLLGVDVVDTVSDSKKATLKFGKPEIVYQMKPVYDLMESEPIKELLLAMSSREEFRKYCEKYGGYEAIKKIKIPDGTTKIDDNFFYGYRSLESVEIPDSVNEIGWSAFDGCSSLVSVEIPSNVKEINGSVFNGCSSLVSVKIPDSVNEIGWSAFDGCSSLVSVEIPNSVKKIGREAFDGCSSLASVEIPDSVEEIDENAFNDFRSLESVTIEAKTPPKYGAYIFDNGKLKHIYVPAKSVKAYKKAPGWKKYAKIIEAMKEN